MTGNTGGFTLIEGMVAAVVLATGLLALSGMQAISLTRNVDAGETTRVTNLASDLVERIQFNRSNARFYDGIDTANACTIDATAQPMARGDCDQWRSLLTGTFGSGLAGVRGQVTVNPNSATTPLLNQRTVTVTISWTSDATANQVARTRQVALTTIVAPE
jgi:type IV pilus assembly protein PilV